MAVLKLIIPNPFLDYSVKQSYVRELQGKLYFLQTFFIDYRRNANMEREAEDLRLTQ